MSAPPEKKSKESNTISMVVKDWKFIQVEQFSDVHRIGGYPWRLRLFQSKKNNRMLTLICDKSSESDLWECSADIHSLFLSRFTYDHLTSPRKETVTFTSWQKDSQEFEFKFNLQWSAGDKIEVEINVKDDGGRWRLRPILHPLDPRDGILVIGEEMKKIYVSKESLASQSPFFDRLFNGNFKEKTMSEIWIGNVEYDELCNLIMMVYGFDAALTDDNVHRVLELADRFELKTVEDRVVSFLLSSSLPLQEKLVITENFNIPFLKNRLLGKKAVAGYTSEQMTEFCLSPEWDQISKETIRILFERLASCKR